MKGVYKLTISYNKQGFCRAVRAESQRAIFSVRFLLSITMVCSWMLINAAESVKTYEHAVFAGITQLIRLGVDGHSSTGPVLLAVSTIPYAFSYLDEKECGFQQQVEGRIGVLVYGLSKLFANFLAAFLMGFVALWTYVGLLSLIGIPHTVRYEEIKNTYAVLAVTFGPGWYYLTKSFLLGLICGQAALFSLMVMAWIPNIYVGFLSPLIGYYLAECIFSLVTQVVSSPFWALVNPMQLFFGQPASNAGFSYLWTVFILMMLITCFGIRFLLQLGKEHA